MFQYAFLRSLEASYPTVDIRADLSAYILTDYHYGFELNRVFPNVVIREAPREDIKRMSNHISPIRNTFINRNIERFRILSKYLTPSKKRAVIKNFYGKDPSILFRLPPEKEYYFDGFWQGEPFYQNAMPDLLDDFRFNDILFEEFRMILGDFNETVSVAVHVRRGDYVGNPYFDVLPESYYRDSIAYMQDMYPESFFYLFSDDPEYCEEKFSFLERKKVLNVNKGSDSYKDMFLMSQCKHNIIANSSFSYWAATLNANREKRVISPAWHEGYSFPSKGWIIIK